MNTDNQWSKQEVCFARGTQVWLAVSHKTSVTSGEWARRSKRIARVSELAAVNHICVIHETLKGCTKNSKGSLKNCFENVNINS